VYIYIYILQEALNNIRNDSNNNNNNNNTVSGRTTDSNAGCGIDRYPPMNGLSDGNREASWGGDTIFVIGIGGKGKRAREMWNGVNGEGRTKNADMFTFLRFGDRRRNLRYYSRHK
jgi:hypothetical protein